jgi:hypothetical protein
MDRKIFDSNLSIEAVSAYLLCCALADTGLRISTAALLERWNSSPASLHHSLAELQQRQIIRRILSHGEGADIFAVNPAEKWKDP